MPEPLVIVGAGGFGREAVDVVEALNGAASVPVWDLIGVVDDAPSEENLDRLAVRGLHRVGSTDDLLARFEHPWFVVGIGNPTVRQRVAERCESAGLRAATLVHPAATLGSQVALGGGTVVCAGARLTTNITVGRHVHINPNCTIGHDTTLADFVSLNPASSISGDCEVRPRTLVGVGAVVLNQVTVGADVVVGAAACVVHDVPDGAVVKGVPGRWT